MKRTYIISILFLLVISCTDDNNTIPAEIRLTVTGECTALISIYNPTGKQLKKETYNCDNSPLVIHINYNGLLIIHAESGTKTQKKTINVANNKTTEITITL